MILMYEQSIKYIVLDLFQIMIPIFNVTVTVLTSHLDNV